MTMADQTATNNAAAINEARVSQGGDSEASNANVSQTSESSAFASAFGESAFRGPKRKRNRMVLSCQPCHQRKQQCDREQPCQRCVQRGLGEDCYYEQHSDLLQKNLLPSNLSDRVVQLEAVVQGMLGDIDPPTHAGLEVLLQMVQNGDVLTTTRALLAAQAAAQRSASDSVTSTSLAGPTTSTSGWPSATLPPSPATLIAQFPPHGIITYLLRHFFDYSSLHWIWPMVHRPVFDACYMTFSAGTHPQSLDFIALLAVVCASALQFLPESAQDATVFAEYLYGRHVLQRRMFDIARSLILAPQFMAYPSIERIQAAGLLAVYTENEGNIIESYNAAGSAIRMAQALAMNRDALRVWRMRPYDAEQRRRFWWILFVLDRLQSATLRRPYIIHEQHMDVAMPMNLDQGNMFDTPDLQGYPPTVATEYLFHIEQVKWTRLVGRMYDKCFGIGLPTYRMVIDIEEEIRTFETNIPAPLNAKVAQSTEAPPYLAFQRQYLTLQVSHLRIILMRPFLFALPQSEGSLPEMHRQFLSTFSRHARAVCIYYCKQLLSLSHLMQKQLSRAQLRWANIVMRIFDSALTLAVAIVMDSAEQNGKGLDVWITLAKEVLRAMSSHNSIAQSALHGVDAISTRVQTIIGQRNPMPSLADAQTDQANLASAQAQPSLTDLLGKETAQNPVWATIEATVFAGNLPGFEALCSPMLAHAMDDFLTNCLAALRR